MKINFLGDSITEGAGAEIPENMYTYLVCKHFNAEELNFGKSGTRIARQVKKTDSSYEEYFMLRAVKMPTDADFTFVFGGTNDYGHGDAKIGEFVSTDNYTFYGAFKELVAYLVENFPKEKLCFILPLPRYNQDDLLGDGYKDEPIAPLSRYIQAEKEVLEYFGVDYLDLSDSFYVPTEPNNTGLFVDGLHPNPNGYKVIADRLIAYLEQKL